MNNTLSIPDRTRISEILDYWHKIEFFTPFDLDARLNECDNWQYQWINVQDLKKDPFAIRQPTIPDDTKVLSSYDLFIGIFKKSEATNICDQFLGATTDEITQIDEEERTDRDGDTCFAKIKLSEDGVPALDKCSVSTLPWALGRVMEQNLSSLSYHSFKAAEKDLEHRLHNWSSIREEGPIKGHEILDFYNDLCDWASFRPNETGYVAVLIANTKSKRPDTKQNQTIANTPSPVTQVSQQTPQASTTDDDEEEEEKEDPGIDILNSLFIRDLELAIDSARSGQVPETLIQYLAIPNESERMDLNGVPGRKKIISEIHIGSTNRGHWFDPPERPMSLMQQFGINLATQSESPLFAINGPPGTGKTTLLRELFAENIVRRARVLANLSKATDAFSDRPSVEVKFPGLRTYKIRPLKPDITGFEMVVASTNNAAVENISVDLPKPKSLNDPWSAQKYLQSVAYKVTAQKTGLKFKPLTAENIPWGLISIKLGNSDNRFNFKTRFLDMPDQRKKKPTSSNVPIPLTIIQWIESYRGPTFEEARLTFCSADEAVNQRIASLQRLDELNRFFTTQSFEAYAKEQIQERDQHRILVSQAHTRFHLEELKKMELESRYVGLRENERLLQQAMPSFWSRLLNTTEARQHREKIRENANAQLAIRSEIDAIVAIENNSKQQLKLAEATLIAAVHQLKAVQSKWESTRSEFDQLTSTLKHSITRSTDHIESVEIQINGFLHDPLLASLRTKLFKAALELHEAWLADVGKHGSGFLGNIYAMARLLEGNMPDDSSFVTPIWQSLFMIAPVISTTFASFADQFKHCGPGSIGWVYIDEAGQAVPQAAVGALWRAKHSIVVGDPLQIEPVFTLPSRLISVLSDLSDFTKNHAYDPDLVSVQKLSDQSNRYGVYLPDEHGEPMWVGSPLRVHRRCINPMFNLSNKIAYNDKMIFGLEKDEKPDCEPIALPSCWIDIGGSVQFKQEVPQQTTFVVQVIMACFCRYGRLPDLYVITPFKAIKKGITQGIKTHFEKDIISQGVNGLKITELKDWCKTRVGTVHTFQGKEEDTVIFVLGVDQQHTGSAEWAARKPNILNVALTRAKRRFYVVGDRALWSRRRYFSWVAEQLPCTAPEEVLEHL
jgi:hypothetical protein